MKKPTRIWLQKHVVQGRLPILDKWYREHIDAVADPGTEISIRSLPPSAYPSDTPHDYVACGSVAIHFNNYFANTALQAEREGYDAWVIAAGQDPGLPNARCLSTIPTLGMGATAFHYCAQKEIRFAIVGFIPGLREPIIENLHRYRTDHLLACYSLLPGGKSSVLSAMKGTPDQLLEEATAAAGQAVAAGAQVIIPAEGLITEALWAKGIRSLQGLPVLDTLGLLIKTAETEVRLKAMGCIARPSTGFWYARPAPEIIHHLETTFAGHQSPPNQVTS